LFPFFSSPKGRKNKVFLPKENEKVPEGKFLPLVPRRGKEKKTKGILLWRKEGIKKSR
jgi:hypothetical protein